MRQSVRAAILVCVLVALMLMAMLGCLHQSTLICWALNDPTPGAHWLWYRLQGYGPVSVHRMPPSPEHAAQVRRHLQQPQRPYARDPLLEVW